MAIGFSEVLIITHRCIPYHAAQLLALNEHANKHSFGCVPTDVQLLEHGALRIMVVVDDIDAWWVFNTWWLRKYTTKNDSQTILWSCEIPGWTVQDTALARVLHISALMTALASHFKLGCIVQGGWRRCLAQRLVELSPRSNHPHRLASFIEPLTEFESVNIIKYAEQLKVHLLAEHPNPQVVGQEAPMAKTGDCHATELAVPASSLQARVPGRTQYLQRANVVINLADQANLWRVAYLGPLGAFVPPDLLWLTGTSPNDIRAIIELNSR